MICATFYLMFVMLNTVEKEVVKAQNNILYLHTQNLEEINNTVKNIDTYKSEPNNIEADNSELINIETHKSEIVDGDLNYEYAKNEAVKGFEEKVNLMDRHIYMINIEVNNGKYKNIDELAIKIKKVLNKLELPFREIDLSIENEIKLTLLDNQNKHNAKKEIRIISLK